MKVRVAVAIIWIAHRRFWRLIPRGLYLWAGDVWFDSYVHADDH